MNKDNKKIDKAVKDGQNTNNGLYVYYFNDNLYINLTNRCCNDCEFCLRRNGDGIMGDVLRLTREPESASEVIELIKLEKRPYDEIIFCGYGESTYKLNQMLQIADFAHSIGKKTRLNTNGLGSLINGFDIVPYIAGKIDSVSVSLNEADEQKYNAICHPAFGIGSYQAILDFSAKCVLAKVKTTLTVVDVIPAADIEKCRLYAKNIGASFKVRSHITDNNEYN